MGKAKTGEKKFRIKYMVGDKEVKPVRIGSSMWWVDDANTVRVKTWERREVIAIGDKR